MDPIPEKSAERREAARETDSRTRALLVEFAAQPEEHWPRLVTKIEQRLRVLLHFRMTAAARALVEEEDLVQDVFAELARNLDRFDYRGPGSLHRWVAGIAMNKIREASREAARVPVTATALEAWPPGRDEPPGGLVEAIEARSHGPSSDLRQRELEERIRAALSGISAPHREALLLRVYEGLSGREAAARLGIDESTFSTRFRRALGVCGRKLAEYGP